MEYEHQKIEAKWQKFWDKKGIYKAKDFSKMPKFYVLVEFPYPSGEGLHVGHCRSYIALDILARKRRMKGQNVLFPMGWDAFGLPTENYAIKKGIHPIVATKKNTDNYRKQLKSLGFSFDWSREINTTDPSYYKWTQWIFLQLFKNGLAYKAKIPINWCPSCKIGLANEEVINEKCERCGSKTEKKEKEQWMLKITKYADRLIKDLDKVDYLEEIKTQQINWIGRSEGALIKFPLTGGKEFIDVFTTRIDTIFSGTFIILSPGHAFINNHKARIQNWNEVLSYINSTKNISDIERTSQERDVTGVELKGVFVINPATQERIPVWVADFVLEHYGTGAVFADAHDQRDFKMAKKYNLPLKTSLIPEDLALAEKVKNMEVCFEGEGTLYNSSQFNGLSSAEARPKIISWLKQNGLAENKTSYKLRDWVFSRQHYWGEPIPLIFCENCKKLAVNSKFKIQNSKSNIGEILNPGWVAVSEKDLPLELPKVKKYQPTDTGESPLALITKWVNVKCPKCKGPAKRETDVMPNWAGSNWYYIKYTDTKDNKKLADSKKLKYWLPVDWYNGGMEHVTLHLLYSRFIFKFLWDIGAVPKEIGSEPYKKRTAHGLVLGEGGVKMSKSKGNVVNPNDIVKKYGADTMRIYEMFMGPFDQMIPWDTKGVVGVRRFLEKIYKLANLKFQSSNLKTILKPKFKNPKLETLIQKTTKKVSEDIENTKFNTAVSAMMILVNEMIFQEKNITEENIKQLLILLSPFAPHLAEELWEKTGFKGLCCVQPWPKYNPKLIKEEKINLIVQINGKVRDKIEVKAGITEEEAKKIALDSEKIIKWIGDKKSQKIIYVAGKIINIVF